MTITKFSSSHILITKFILVFEFLYLLNKNLSVKLTFFTPLEKKICISYLTHDSQFKLIDLVEIHKHFDLFHDLITKLSPLFTLVTFRSDHFRQSFISFTFDFSSICTCDISIHRTRLQLSSFERVCFCSPSHSRIPHQLLLLFAFLLEFCV